jgi:hypothetical protein
MPIYRCYLFNRDGRPLSAHEQDCTDIDAAIAWAAKLFAAARDFSALELWHEETLVHRESR